MVHGLFHYHPRHEILPIFHQLANTLPYSWPLVAHLEMPPLFSEVRISVIPTFLSTLGMVLNKLCAQCKHSAQYTSYNLLSNLKNNWKSTSQKCYKLEFAFYGCTQSLTRLA